MDAVEELQSLSLKLLINKKKNEVIFAEADNNFVDVLFSFMTIPVGALIKLIGNQPFSCTSNLYASVENLDDKFLANKICREVLLHPRSACEIYWRDLKVNLYETDGNEYFGCGYCSFLGYYYQNGKCRCGNPLQYKLESPSPSPTLEGSFTKSTTRFMLTDDLQVRPISIMAGLTLLKSCGADEKCMLEERTINVGKDKILELLKLSLVSKTPLTEAFLNSVPHNKRSFSIFDVVPGNVGQCQERVSRSTKEVETISVKLIINSINNTVLYAEAANDFVNLLYSFLTFPVGYLFQKNLYLPFKGCMNNVYKSINDIEVELFKSSEMKEALIDSKLVPGLAQNKQIISINDATKPTYSDLRTRYKASPLGRTSGFVAFGHTSLIDDMSLKSRHEEAEITNGFIKGPSSFMVMDNLTVMPLSSISGLCLIKKMDIPFGNIVQKEVVMGETEAMRLFTASMVAENALTDAFLCNEIKQEKEIFIKLPKKYVVVRSPKPL